MPILIPIEIGDVIRVGKFKNKRITVKEIGLDEFGLPTCNGKGILKIRIEKLIPPKEPKQEIHESMKNKFKIIQDDRNSNPKVMIVSYINPEPGKNREYYSGNVEDFVIKTLKSEGISAELATGKITREIKQNVFAVRWNEIKTEVNEGPATNDPKIQRLVDVINQLIKSAIDSDGDPIGVIDTSSSWEEPYVYSPIEYKNGALKITSRSEYKNKPEVDVILKRNMEFDGIPTLKNIAKMYKKAIASKGKSVEENKMTIREKLDNLIYKALTEATDSEWPVPKTKLERPTEVESDKGGIMVKIKEIEGRWRICREDANDSGVTDEYLDNYGYETKDLAEHAALTKGFNFTGSMKMNEKIPEILTSKIEKTKGVDKVEDLKLDKEKEIKLEIFRIAKRVIKEELQLGKKKDQLDEEVKIGDIVDISPDYARTRSRNLQGKKTVKVVELKKKFKGMTIVRGTIQSGHDAGHTITGALIENNLNELEVSDPELEKKVEEMARLSDILDKLKNEVKKIQQQYEPLEDEVSLLLEEISKTGDRALETKNVLVTIKKMGNPKVEVAAYKERFEQLYSKVNGAMKKQADDYWESVKTFKKVGTSIGVQYKKTEGKLSKGQMTEDNVISRLLNSVKNYFSNMYKKIVGQNKQIDRDVNELKQFLA